MSEPLTLADRAEMAARLDRPHRGANGDSARLLAELERVEGQLDNALSVALGRIEGRASVTTHHHEDALRNIRRIAREALQIGGTDGR